METFFRLRVWLGLVTIVFLNGFDVGSISQATGFKIVIDSVSQASLMYKGKLFCVATVISPHYVLTSARCLRNKLPENITIRAGSSSAYEGGRLHQVDKIIVHEYYNVGNDFGIPQNNIALLNVTEPFIEEEMENVIGLYRPGDSLNFTAIAGVFSFGCDRNNSDLLVSWVPTFNRSACMATYKDYGGIHDGDICVSSSKLGKCIGSSGDPMIIGDRLAAINSYRANYCPDQSGNNCPAVYLGISSYYEWIKKNAGLKDT